jgi:hypothetical protein
VDVTTGVKVVSSALVYNRLTQVYSGTITITNTGTVPLARPLNVVLAGISTGATATGTNGTLTGQGPYYTLPGTTPLGPGQAATVNIQFTNPSNARISYTVKVYSGNF